MGAAGWVVYGGGKRQSRGDVTRKSLGDQVVIQRRERQAQVAPESTEQILFGDLHVHTTFSVDAFMWSLPLFGGEGAHPPADACDFARFCSQLDFYALTDHAEALNPRSWRETKESVRQCNSVAGTPAVPDLIAFTGFEWTQVGLTPEQHYGHKNVIFKYTDDARLPARPIAAPGISDRAFNALDAVLQVAILPIKEFPRRHAYLDMGALIGENQDYPICPLDLNTRELPLKCRERAATPADLFRKLGEWNLDSIVIPHGTTWGFYTPRGYVWDKQLTEAQDDPDQQRLVEVFSGHGNSEEYRPFKAVELGEGADTCPPPTDNYEPCCWRAGEIIRARCDDPRSDECERRVERARADYLVAGVAAHVQISGADVPDWGNCGQCTDCFNPSYQYRPGGSVQYMLARGNFDDPESPRHHTLGFMASSDNHSARPGTGYKEVARRKMTEARGAPTEDLRQFVFGERGEKSPESRGLTIDDLMKLPPFSLMFLERQASFFVTGGFVAVHAQGRNREAIWDALVSRNVYGTSGERILLWFDLLNGPEGPARMGSDLALARAPRFQVRAAGAFEQDPGCPQEVVDALGTDRLQRMCAGECYNPTDRRRKITRVEVIRIRPQVADDEPIAPLIEDPWLSLACDGKSDLCTVEFEDPEFPTLQRDVLYYVRAIQEPTPAVNAGGVRCRDDVCEPCYGNYRTDFADDCLVDNEERAWSSPIYLRATPSGAERVSVE